MKHSGSIKELAAALAKAQGKLTGAVKDSTNPHFKSRYADLSSCVAALKEAFPECGLSYVQTIVTGEASVGVETMLLHSSGDWICGDPFFVPVVKADAQGFGSALTYCRRYSLCAVAGLAPADDDGNAATDAKPKAMPRQEFVDWCTKMGEATTLIDLVGAKEMAKAAADSYGDAVALKSFAEKFAMLKTSIPGTHNTGPQNA